MYQGKHDYCIYLILGKFGWRKKCEKHESVFCVHYICPLATINRWCDGWGAWLGSVWSLRGVGAARDWEELICRALSASEQVKSGITLAFSGHGGHSLGYGAQEDGLTVICPQSIGLLSFLLHVLAHEWSTSKQTIQDHGCFNVNFQN